MCLCLWFWDRLLVMPATCPVLPLPLSAYHPLPHPHPHACTLQELMRSLKRVQEKLGGYAAVNKKALDQYTSFKDQREELHRRHAEILESGGRRSQGGGGTQGGGAEKRCGVMWSAQPWGKEGTWGLGGGQGHKRGTWCSRSSGGAQHRVGSAEEMPGAGVVGERGRSGWHALLQGAPPWLLQCIGCSMQAKTAAKPHMTSLGPAIPPSLLTLSFLHTTL